jgi:hypothetical protein
MSHKNLYLKNINVFFLGSKARVRSSETKVLRFDSIVGNLVTSGKTEELSAETRWHRGLQFFTFVKIIFWTSYNCLSICPVRSRIFYFCSAFSHLPPVIVTPDIQGPGGGGEFIKT